MVSLALTNFCALGNIKNSCTKLVVTPGMLPNPSFLMQVYTNRVRLFLFGIYVNVYLRGKHILYNEIATLWKEDENVKRFPMADKDEIFHFDDVCAICLGGMKNARKTHCKHLFHDHCLSLAVQASPNCLTCKAIL